LDQGDSEKARERISNQPIQKKHQTLLGQTSKGKIIARQMKKAMILVKANESMSVSKIMAAQCWKLLIRRVQSYPSRDLKPVR